MKKTTIRSLARILLATILTLTACSNDDNSPTIGDETSSSSSDVSSSSVQTGNNPSSSSITQSNSSSSIGSSSSTEGISCSSSTTQSSSSIYIGTGGKGNDISKYETKKIGDQTWMAENLNYDVEGSKCYDNLESNCDIYGRLYDWATAMGIDASYNSARYRDTDPAKHQGICPEGWHIPTQAEWNTLSSYISSDKGCSNCDAKHLKATYDWYNNGNGLDSYGFAALPGGYGYSDGDFNYAGNDGYWWSASELTANNAYYRLMYYNFEDAIWYYLSKTYLRSLRCLQDQLPESFEPLLQ